ncbi:MAG: glycosyltransferase family 2 protein [Candidatus Levyibacteriota bacterium]
MKNQFQKKTCTCIIPFYNENERILAVLNVMSQVKNLTKIICVDDGSTDNSSELIKQNFKQVQVIRNEKNQGKAAAVEQALRSVKTEYVLLFDADIHHFRKSEIEQALTIVFTDASVGMLLLRRTHEPFFIRATRGELVLSGERILSTQDLLAIYKQKPQRYQLEIVINLYMTSKKKKVFWYAYSGRNTFKTKKVGIWKGFSKELQMYRNIIDYIGYKKYLENLLFFCRTEYPR